MLLLQALKELNFCVIAFANLSLSEVRDAVDLFWFEIGFEFAAKKCPNVKRLGPIFNPVFLNAKISYLAK